MNTGFFLIPMSSMMRKGKVTIPLDYRVERRKIDKRTRFYRNFIKWEVLEAFAVGAAQRTGLRLFRENGAVTRILAPDAKSARAFFEYMQNNFDFGKERV